MKTRGLEVAMALGVAGLLGLIAFAAGLPEPVGSAGQTHPVFSTLERAAEGVAQRGDLILLGWLAGILEIVVLVCGLALGLRRGGRVGAGAGWLWAGGVLLAGVWTALVVSYETYFRSGSDVLWGSLPIPTAIMIYGLWPAPLVFAGLYVWRFDPWVLDEQSLERVRALARDRKEKDER